MSQPNKCQMCNRAMSSLSKGDCCSGKCRTAKSRLKSDFGKNILLATHAIRAMTKAIELGLIDGWKENQEIEQLRELMEKLSETNYQSWAVKKTGSLPSFPDSIYQTPDDDN